MSRHAKPGLIRLIFFQDLEDSIVKICILMQKKSENIIMKCHFRKLQF